MLRLGEVVLFLAPFAAYAIFHMTVIRGRSLSGRTLLLEGIGLAVLGGGLDWLGTRNGLGRYER